MKADWKGWADAEDVYVRTRQGAGEERKKGFSWDSTSKVCNSSPSLCPALRSGQQLCYLWDFFVSARAMSNNLWGFLPPLTLCAHPAPSLELLVGPGLVCRVRALGEPPTPPINSLLPLSLCIGGSELQLLGNGRWRLLRTMLSCHKPSGQVKDQWPGNCV